jgi:hypothetical protein
MPMKGIEKQALRYNLGRWHQKLRGELHPKV